MIALLTACVWISDREAEERLDRDDDGFLPIELGGEDCDDGDATIQPDASELCGDGVDNDCDGLTDEGVTTVWYPDEDGDHLGDPDKPYSACSAPDGYTEDNSDCDDTRAEVLGPQACWVDFDGDGYGDEDASSSPNCDPDGPGVASNNSDCDDTRAEVYPEATEICDGHDNDCYGDTDEDAEDASIWYLDYDSDS